jgi:hypothetical protein
LQAERGLGYKETDAIEDDAVDTLVNEAHDGAQPQPRLNAIPATTVGRGRGDCSPSPQPSPVDVSREPKRLKTNEHESLRIISPPVPEPIRRDLARSLSRSKGGTALNEEVGP